MLDLSTFTTKGGKPVPVTGTILGETSFNLAPCQQREVTLVIECGAIPVGTDVNSFVVDDCLVAVADLRVQGCDVRPIRIAVALLPIDCSAFEVHCGCGCC